MQFLFCLVAVFSVAGAKADVSHLKLDSYGNGYEYKEPSLAFAPVPQGNINADSALNTAYRPDEPTLKTEPSASYGEVQTQAPAQEQPRDLHEEASRNQLPEQSSYGPKERSESVHTDSTSSFQPNQFQPRATPPSLLYESPQTELKLPNYSPSQNELSAQSLETHPQPGPSNVSALYEPPYTGSDADKPTQRPQVGAEYLPPDQPKKRLLSSSRGQLLPTQSIPPNDLTQHSKFSGPPQPQPHYLPAIGSNAERDSQSQYANQGLGFASSPGSIASTVPTYQAGPKQFKTSSADGYNYKQPQPSFSF